MRKLLRYRNVIFSLIIAIVFLMAFRAVSSHFSNLQQQLNAEKKEFAKGEEMLEEWGWLTKEHDRLSGNFLHKDTLLLNKFIEMEAQDARIKITSLSSSRKEVDFYWEVLIELRLIGEFKNLIKFAKSLEERQIDIENITFTSVRDTLNIEMSVKGIIIK